MKNASHEGYGRVGFCVDFQCPHFDPKCVNERKRNKHAKRVHESELTCDIPTLSHCHNNETSFQEVNR